MDYRVVAAFVAKLREYDTVAAMALEFCILTAARSGEVYGAAWSEIDMATKVWILPAKRMKGSAIIASLCATVRSPSLKRSCVVRDATTGQISLFMNALY